MNIKKEEKTHTIDPSEMVPVSTDEFVEGSILPVDVFVKLSADKFVLIARQGSKADFSQMQLSERDDVDKFYVRKNDYKNHVGQNLVIAGVLLSKAEINDSKKISFLGKTVDSVFKEITHLGFNHETMEHAKTVSNNIQMLVQSKSDLSAVIILMNEISDELIRHSSAVAAVSVIIAKQMGWSLPATLEKLALGGLLHDIGMKELPSELLSKARHEMTYEEQMTYESHPFRGVEILRSMPNIHEDILAITFEHHENSIGQGYPRKLRDFKLNPLAKVTIVANAFVELTMMSAHHPNPKSSEEAVKYIEVTLGQPYSKPVFLALKQSLSHSAKVKKSA